MTFGGWDLPAGVHIGPSIYLLHRRPDLYPDPLAFRPERFLERSYGTYEWIPFGGGIRRCLGARRPHRSGVEAISKPPDGPEDRLVPPAIHDPALWIRRGVLS